MTTTKLASDSFASHVPKLSNDGSNWVIFKTRFQWYADARELSRHIVMGAIEPTMPVTIVGKDFDKMTTDEQTLFTEHEKSVSKWKADEAKLKQGFAEVLPDSLFMKVIAKKTALEIWTVIAGEFEKRSRMIVLDLRRQLQNQKCKDGEDVRTHFAKIRSLRESLAAMGATLTDDDSAASILGSLPSSYDTFLSALTAAESVLGKSLTPDELMHSIIEEADRRSVRNQKAKKDEKDVSFLAVDRKDNRKEERTCFNCGKKGHVKRNCWGKGGGKEGQGPKGKKKADEKPKAAAAKTMDFDGAWTAIVDDSDDVVLSSDEESIYHELFEDDDEMPGLVDASESDSDDDDEMPGLVDRDFSDSDDDDELCCVVDMDGDAYTTTFEYAMLVDEGGTQKTKVELYDSGASCHMSPFHDDFINFVPIVPKSITAADQRSFQAIGKGDVCIEVPNGETPTRIMLKDVLYAPSMALTLVSISRIAAAGYTTVFRDTSCRIYHAQREPVGEISVDGGLYRVHHLPLSEAAAPVEETVTINELHRRMGHIAHEAARDLVKKKLVEGLVLDETSQPTSCDSCEFAKKTRKPIQKERHAPRPSAPGEEVYSDVWGPAPTRSIGGREYYVSFIDGHQRWSEIELMRHKDETFDAYLKYESESEAQYKVRIKKLFSDRGGEYTSDAFKKHLGQRGTQQKLTVHDTPEYNGIAERFNRTVLEKVRAMLHASGLPKFLWGEAVKHANYLRNRTSTKALDGKTPYEMKFGTKPNLAGLHEWGAKVWVHDKTGSKLEGRSRIGRWVGYEEASNAHRIYWPDKRKVTVERSIKFDENDILIPATVPLEGEFEPEDVQTPTVLTPVESPPTATAPTPIVHEETAPAPELLPLEDPLSENFERPKEGRGLRVRKESSYVQRLRSGEGTIKGTKNSPILPKGLPSATSVTGPEETRSDVGAAIDVDIGFFEFAMSAMTDDDLSPDPTFDEARNGHDWPRWREAIKKELEALELNGTWEVVERPPGTNVVSSKWVLHIKRNAEGKIDKFKARLVARRFTQIHGQDYFDTFAPVARLASFRTIVAIAARNDWPIDSFDFHSAYLNGELEEEVFMEQPPSFEFANREKYVLKLKKALYGLKQGGRRWYETLTQMLTDMGFKRSDADHAVFYKLDKDSLTVLVIYVDDCAITGNSTLQIENTKRELQEKFRLTDMGPLSWMLGIAVTQDRAARTISLSQRSYIDTILSRCKFANMTSRATPMDPNIVLSKEQSPQTPEDIEYMKNVPYRKCIGMLMWADLGTRPDIAFAVSALAQFSENPGIAHWEAVKRVFRYLKGTRDYVLTYGTEKTGLIGYSDADGNSQEHRRAISGYAYLIDGGAVSWTSKKQELVTLSTTESEYVATTHAAKEGIWLHRLISELFRPLTDPTSLLCDNQSAIALSKDGSFHARTKHIDIRYHFIRYVIEEGSIELIYCPTDDMAADILTKPLPAPRILSLAKALGLHVSAV
jgi:Reverse transcriptase (RNA-dependent DNA polymerase)/gag-polypeptide of LTR copia-type